MRKINRQVVVDKVTDLCVLANFDIEEDVFNSYKESLSKENNPLAKEILSQIIENAEIAAKKREPLCQDTGAAVFFVKLGREVHLDFDLDDAINEGVRDGYQKGYLRNSIVSDPFNRVNTGDNTPAIIHLELVSGDKLEIIFMPKGGGAENMSALKMMVPADGVDGVKQFVLEVVKEAGGKVCPPTILGIGVGGTFDSVALLAKKALLRELGSSNRDPFYDTLEKELLSGVNELDIGPMGFGGKTTCLGVFIETYPCHLASLPVAVNIQCHSARHKSVVIIE